MTSTGPSAAGRRAALAAGALAIAAIFAAHARAWWFVCDDAFISFRYAEALATRGALEYNPGERVEGYTNFLWVLALALGRVAGARPEALALALGGAAALAGLGLAAALCRRLRGGGAWAAVDLAPAAALAATPEYAVWASGGLEGAAAAALTMAAMLAWLSGHVRRAGLWGALAALTRPDSVVALAGFAAARAGLAAARALGGGGRVGGHGGEAAAGRGAGAGGAARRVEGGSGDSYDVGRLRAGRGWRARLARAAPPGGWRRLAAAALIFAAPLAAHLAFRRVYYGAWLPNTWAIKAHGALLRETTGVAYVGAWAAGVGAWALGPLAALLRARHLTLALPIAAGLVYAWSVGGDFMAYGRLLVTTTALAAALCGWLLADLGAWAGRRWRGGAWLGVGLGAALAAAQGARAPARWRADMATGEGWLDGRWEGVRAMDRFARERLAAGRWMRDNMPEGTWISVGAAGALPYASGLPAIDVLGLTEPRVGRLPGLAVRAGAGARPGHQVVAPLDYVRGRDPALYCHLGAVGPEPPAAAAARRRGLGPAARWACAPIGATPARHEPGGALAPFFYCCLRLRGREVGPFTDAEAGG